MWAQLAMSGLKSLQDNRDKQNNLASNVITQKYSPWTGQRADFSAQGKSTGMSNMIAGFGSGMLQDKLDARDAEDAAAKSNDAQAENRDAGDYYSKLSANPASVGVSPIGAKSSFAAPARAPAGRDPAVDVGGNQLPPGQSLPAFMQGENPWLSMAQQPVAQRQPQMSDFHQPAKSFSPSGSQWFANSPVGQSMGWGR